MLTLTLQPSRWLKRAVWALLGLAVLAIMLAALPAWAQWGGLALLGIVAFRRRAQGALRLQCQADGGLSLMPEGVVWRPVALLPGSVVNPWLTVIRYRDETSNKTGSLLILPDSLDEDDFRRLRIWLKWKAVFSLVRQIG